MDRHLGRLKKNTLLAPTFALKGTAAIIGKGRGHMAGLKEGDSEVGKTNQLQFKLAMQTREPLTPLRLSFFAGEMGPADRTAARTYYVMVPTLETGQQLGY